MKRSLLFLGAALAAGTLSAADEAAQPVQAVPSWSAKIAIQSAFASVDGVENGYGASICYATPLGDGLIKGELGYTFYPGKDYLADIGANPLGLSSSNALDDRKHNLKGFSLRLGYQQLFVEDWSWQAGLSLTNLKDDCSADMSFAPGGNTVSSWNSSTSHTSTAVAPYAGIRYDVTDVGAVEFNVVMVKYDEVTVTPNFSMNGVTYTVGTHTVNRPKLELAYIFKF